MHLFVDLKNHFLYTDSPTQRSTKQYKVHRGFRIKKNEYIRIKYKFYKR